MMDASVEIVLECKPVSVNASLMPAIVNGHARLIKNTKKSDSLNEIKYLVMKKKNSLLPLLNGFDPKSHYFISSYFFYYPVDQFWTKKKEISSRMVDLDNSVKALKDTIFSTIGINDKFSCRETSGVYPFHCNTPFIRVSISRNKWTREELKLRGDL